MFITHSINTIVLTRHTQRHALKVVAARRLVQLQSVRLTPAAAAQELVRTPNSDSQTTVTRHRTLTLCAPSNFTLCALVSATVGLLLLAVGAGAAATAAADAGGDDGGSGAAAGSTAGPPSASATKHYRLDSVHYRCAHGSRKGRTIDTRPSKQRTTKIDQVGCMYTLVCKRFVKDPDTVHIEVRSKHVGHVPGTCCTVVAAPCGTCSVVVMQRHCAHWCCRATCALLWPRNAARTVVAVQCRCARCCATCALLWSCCHAPTHLYTVM